MIEYYLPIMETMHEALMTDRVSIYRNGVLVAANVQCRATSNRLFAEPADPTDANMRSMSEWGFTMPSDTDLCVGDHVISDPPFAHIDCIIGEVVQGDTWQIALRAWGNRPKLATPNISVVLYRYDIDLDDWVAQAAQSVQVVYDRNQPKETPIRYTPAAASSYQGGWLVGDMDFDVEVEDRFQIDNYGGIIVEILPTQPQHKEARFVIDVSGAR